jgi:phosphoglycerate dehydrogenase-like enzyme
MGQQACCRALEERSQRKKTQPGVGSVCDGFFQYKPKILGRANRPSMRLSFMPMSSFQLLVIADPTSPHLTSLSRLPQDIRVVVTQDPEELRARAAEADAVVFAHGNGDLLTGVLPFLDRARWIHSLWTGVEGILSPELLEHPATLTNGRGVFRWPLADWVVAAMLFFAFDLRRVLQQQEQGVWKPFISTTLEGRTLGIVGYGAIGSAVASRARPFGMKIVALRRRPELFKDDSLVDQSYSPGELRELMAASDYVLVVTPLTSDTRGLIGEAEIGLMKPSGVIMNVGRGPVIDEPALVRALQSGAIRGAALDVFTNEPLPADHPFWKMRNVLLSPHTADRVEGFLIPAFECFFENLARFRNGNPLLNVVDKGAGY